MSNFFLYFCGCRRHHDTLRIAQSLKSALCQRSPLPFEFKVSWPERRAWWAWWAWVAAEFRGARLSQSAMLGVSLGSHQCHYQFSARLLFPIALSCCRLCPRPSGN